SSPPPAPLPSASASTVSPARWSRASGPTCSRSTAIRSTTWLSCSSASGLPSSCRRPDRQEHARGDGGRARAGTRVNREYHRWYSPLLGRDMELLLFGHAGARVLVFPPSMGRFYDWEDRGMIAALQPHLDNGWVQLYCVDSVDAESWYNQAIAPAERARRHSQYDQYLVD